MNAGAMRMTALVDGATNCPCTNIVLAESIVDVNEGEQNRRNLMSTIITTFFSASLIAMDRP